MKSGVETKFKDNSCILFKKKKKSQIEQNIDSDQLRQKLHLNPYKTQNLLHWRKQTLSYLSASRREDGRLSVL